MRSEGHNKEGKTKKKGKIVNTRNKFCLAHSFPSRQILLIFSCFCRARCLRQKYPMSCSVLSRNTAQDFSPSLTLLLPPPALLLCPQA